MALSQFQIFQHSHSRRFLLQHQPPPVAAAPPAAGNHETSPGPYSGDNRFDANVVMVLSVLLCALICSLGLNSIVRCALRCSRFTASNSSGGVSARLANTGVKKKALKTFPVVNFSPELNLPGLDSECVICLSEFAADERVRVLPKCNHGFHVRCIDKWLNSHSSCPTCRHCLIETCQKIVGCGGQASALPATATEAVVVLMPPQDNVVRIVPLEPEGLVSIPAAAVVHAPPQESVIRILPLEPEGLVRNYES
ncbi:hypothetical protein LguiA_003347 [Lonicera macranthoides]